MATGEAHTVREFVDEAFSYVDLDYQDYVKIDPKYFRPTEVDYLEADAGKAKKILGWEPKVKYHDLVRIMMDADLELVGLEVPERGRRSLKSALTVGIIGKIKSSAWDNKNGKK